LPCTALLVATQVSPHGNRSAPQEKKSKLIKNTRQKRGSSGAQHTNATINATKSMVAHTSGGVDTLSLAFIGEAAARASRALAVRADPALITHTPAVAARAVAVTVQITQHSVAVVTAETGLALARGCAQQHNNAHRRLEDTHTHHRGLTGGRTCFEVASTARFATAIRRARLTAAVVEHPPRVAHALAVGHAQAVVTALVGAHLLFARHTGPRVVAHALAVLTRAAHVCGGTRAVLRAHRYGRRAAARS
jgi:hypothetical protein